MLSWDERLAIGLKVLERLRPMVRNATLPSAAVPAEDTESRDTDETGKEDRSFDQPVSQVDFTPGVKRYQEPPVATFELPALEALIEQSGELTPYSIILGVCEDGLPFLLDLTNPAPGALLAAADKLGGKTRLMKSILASASYLNSPDEVAYYLVAQFPWQYSELEQTDHCQGIHSAKDKEALREMVEELVETVEERRHAGPHGPAIILAIDDLHSLLQTIDEQTFNRLYWMIRHGPRSRLWTIATYSTQGTEPLDERFLAAFRTRLIGRIDDRRRATAISGDSRLDTRHIEKGFEFCVPYGDDWTHFWVCEPAALAQPEPEEDEAEQFYPEDLDAGDM